MTEERDRNSRRVLGDDAEQNLWRCLTHERLARYVFYRQFPINPYVVDFFCPARGTVVEIDETGDPQRVRYETMRRSALEALGYKVLWIDPSELAEDPEEVVRKVAERLEDEPE
jgi:very-short-patch-repair endonuclease